MLSYRVLKAHRISTMEVHTATGHKEHVSVIEKTRRILYGGLYQINQSISTAERFFYISTTITMFQMLYFAVAIQTASNEHPLLVDVLEPALRVFSFGFMPLSSDFAMISLTVIPALLVIVMVMGVVMMGIDDMNNTTRYSFIAPAIDIVFKLNQTVLQIPFLVILLRLVRCDVTFDSSLIVCSGSGYVIEQGMACLTLSLHVIATSIYALVVFHQSPYTIKGRNNKLFAMPHGRIECLATLTRAICTILYMLLLPKVSTVQSTVITSPSNGLAAVIFAGGLITMAGYWYFLPFYNIRWNVFATSCNSFVAWAGVCAFVANSVNNSDDKSTFLLFVVPAPFVITSVVALVYHRIEKLKLASENLFSQSPYLMETRLRLIHQRAQAEEDFAFSGDAEKAYRRALELLPDNPYISLYVSLLASSAGNRIIFALNLLTRVRQSQLPFDLDFTLFCHNKRNAESQTFSSGSVSFIQLDQHLAEARKSLIATLKHTASFWKKITHGNCTLSQILQQGAKVHEESSKCRYHLTRLRKLSRSNREGLKLYALYFYYVMNDRETAVSLERELSTTNNYDEGHGSAVATISGNQSTLGQVLEVSDAMCNLFGFSKSEIIGRNVSVLCPSPFQEMHDMFLKQFISTDSEFATQTRRIFGMHAKGYIMATDFEVTPSTNSNSELILIGRFKKVPLPLGQHILMVDAKTGFVTSFTQMASEAVGFDESEVFAMNLHISDILLDFFDDEDNTVQYRKEREVTVNTQPFKVSARLIEYKNKQDSSVNFHVSIYMVSFHAITDQNLFGHSSVAGRSRMQSPSDPESSKRKMSPILNESDEGSDADSLEDSDDGEIDSESGESAQINQASPDNKAPDQSGKFSAVSTGSDKKKPSRKPSGRLLQDNESVGSQQSLTRRRRRPHASGSASVADTASTGLVLDSRGLEISQVHRRVMRKLQRKDPNLQRFGRFARRFIIFFTLFAIADAVVLMQLTGKFADLSKNVDYAHYSVHLVVLSGLTVLMDIYPTVDVNGTLYERAEVDSGTLLTDFATDIKSIHRDLVDIVSSSGDTRLDTLMNSPLVLSTIDASYYRNLSFHVALLEMVSHINNHVQEDLLECEDSCHFIVNNAPFEIAETLIRLGNQFRIESLHRVEVLHIAELVLICFVAFVLMVYFFKGYLPMFMSNDRRKKHVGKAFLAIPEDICKKLLNRTERRLLQLQTQQETDVTNQQEEDAEIDLDEAAPSHDAEPSEDPRHGIGHAGSDAKDPAAIEAKDSNSKYASQKRSPALVAPLRLPDMAMKKKPTGYSSVKVAPARIGKSGQQESKRLIKKETFTLRVLRTIFLNFHIGISFWTVTAFYTFDFINKAGAETEMKQKAAIVHASGLHAAASSLLHFWAVHPLGAPEWERIGSNEARITRLSNLYDQVVDLDYALRYGDDALGIPAFTYTEGDQFELYFENACDDACEEFLATIPDGEESLSGLEHLRHGLALTFDHWLLNIKEVLDSEVAYLANPSEENLEVVQQSKLPLLNLEPHLIVSEKQFDAMRNYYADEVETVSQEKRVKIISTIILIVALIASHLLSLGAFSKLDQELKKAQAALLLLPLETFTKVPALIRLLNEE